jgi:hypothetical protein
MQRNISITELNQAVAAAQASRQALLGMWHRPQQHIDYYWRHLAEKVRSAEGEPDANTVEGLARRLEILQTAKRAMDAFAVLPEQTACSLAYWHTPGGILGDGTRVWGSKTLTDPAGLLDDHPVLGPIKAEIDKAQAVREAFIEASNTRAREEAAKQAPADLLRRLRGIGVILSLDKGRITCPANVSIAAEDREQIAFHKNALIALMQTEVDAARPVVIA